MQGGPDFLMPVPTTLPTASAVLSEYFREIDEEQLVVELSPLKGARSPPVHCNDPAPISPAARPPFRRRHRSPSVAAAAEAQPFQPHRGLGGLPEDLLMHGACSGRRRV